MHTHNIACHGAHTQCSLSGSTIDHCYLDVAYLTPGVGEGCVHVLDSSLKEGVEIFPKRHQYFRADKAGKFLKNTINKWPGRDRA